MYLEMEKYMKKYAYYWIISSFFFLEIKNL